MAFEQKPGAQGYIDKLANENLFGDVTKGIGVGGKIARQAIKQFGSGADISGNNFFKYKLNQMKAIKSQQDRQRNEDIAANLAFSGQPALTAGIQAEQQNDADQDYQTAIAGAAGDSFQSALDEFFRSRGARNDVALRQAAIREQQLRDAGQLNNDSYTQKQPGFWSSFGKGLLSKGLSAGAGLATGGASTALGF